MPTIAEKIIHGKMERSTNEIETNVMVSGRIFESLPLGLGDTTLSREVLSDGSRGDIEISTQENDSILGNSITYQKYVLKGGDLLPDTRYGERTVSKIRATTVLAKVAFGRVNHWDKETTFHGTMVEDEE